MPGTNTYQLSYKYPTNQATSTLLTELHPHLRIIIFIFCSDLWSPSKSQQAAHSLKLHAPNLPFENGDPEKSAQKELGVSSAVDAVAKQPPEASASPRVVLMQE